MYEKGKPIWKITCDGEGCSAGAAGDDEEALKKYAELCGWEIREACQLCPSCAEKSITSTEAEEVLMSFSGAILALKDGERIARRGWNGKGMWLGLQKPDPHSHMTLPYIYMSTVTGDLVPWLASQTDVLADDWEVVEA